MTRVTIRPARPDDFDAVAAARYAEPPRELVVVAGSEAAARELGRTILRHYARMRGWDRVAVAERDGRVVGALQWSANAAGLPTTPRFVLGVVRVLGLARAWRAHHLQRVLDRVNAPPPRGSLHVEEVHVLPPERGRGVGRALMEHAEAEARRRNIGSLSLVTTMSNPARRLYERLGYQIVQTRTDAEYERLTGVPGRYLMAKPLA